jgi:DUF4097 and DUF4098 domain-containing protein YvlB
MILRIAALMFVTMLAVGLMPQRVHAEDFTKTYTVTGHPHVSVVTNDGSVRVSPGDSDKVEFRVEYHGYVLDKNLKIESEQQGDQVELRARIVEHLHLSFGNSRSVHIEVRMPKDADLRVETGDGAVKADGIAGTVDVRTGDGSITANDLKGTLRLRTGDGSLQGSGLEGQCDASSGDGRIQLTGRFDTLAVQTGDGSIDVTANHGSRLEGPWRLRSGDGSVSLAIPGDLSADVDASSGDGSVTTDIPVTIEGQMSRSHLRGKMNGGGQSLMIHTGDGSIRLNKS